MSRQVGSDRGFRVPPEVYDLVDQVGHFIGPEDLLDDYLAALEPFGVTFFGYRPRLPAEVSQGFQDDPGFREHHLEVCPGCFPEEQQPTTYLVKVRANGKVVRLTNPYAKIPRVNIHPEPDELIKFPAGLYPELGLDGSWRRHPFPHLPGETEEFWAGKRATMARFVAANPWWSSKFFRFRSVAADHDLLAAHFAHCDGQCQPWRITNGDDLHEPFRSLLEGSRS
jgi:hypothetical protein